jgi:hypothetical protein
MINDFPTSAFKLQVEFQGETVNELAGGTMSNSNVPVSGENYPDLVR